MWQYRSKVFVLPLQSHKYTRSFSYQFLRAPQLRLWSQVHNRRERQTIWGECQPRSSHCLRFVPSTALALAKHETWRLEDGCLFIEGRKPKKQKLTDRSPYHSDNKRNGAYHNDWSCKDQPQARITFPTRIKISQNETKSNIFSHFSIKTWYLVILLHWNYL